MPSIQKKIRDLERVLRRQSDESTVEAIKAQIASLKETSESNKTADRERKFSTKYRMVKFVERKKVTRKLKQVDTKLQDASLAEALKEDLHAQRKQLEDDLAYIMYYPGGLKYHALFIDGEDGQDLSRSDSSEFQRSTKSKGSH